MADSKPVYFRSNRNNPNKINYNTECGKISTKKLKSFFLTL